jgi:hypothetical protein
MWGYANKKKVEYHCTKASNHVGVSIKVIECCVLSFVYESVINICHCQ